MPNSALPRPSVRRAAGCLVSLALGLAAALALLLAAGGPPVQAAPLSTLWVVNPGDSIQAKINGASAGDTILINAGTYTESLTLNKPISLTGVSSATVILQAVASQRVLTVTGSTITHSVVISGLTFTGGDVSGAGSFPADCGGGVQLASSAQPLLASLIITGNRAGSGGGLCASFPGALSLADSLVLSNTATNSWGGGVIVSGPATVNGSRLQGNQCLSAGCFGGGLATSNNGALTLTNTTLISNTAQGDGGGARSEGPMVVVGGLVVDNVCAEANCAGGGLATASTLMLTSTQFISNTAGGAAGGLLASGAAAVTNALFEGNSCTQSLCDGGAVLAGSALTLSNTQVLSNTALRFGGGVRASGATVLNAVFQNNACTQAGCHGGGLWVAGPLLVTATQFTSNTATSSGGALYDFGAGTLSAGVFENNHCTQSGCQGGALHVGGDLVLTGTQFLSNTAEGDGGAAATGGAAGLTNAGFENNQCLGSSCTGGGLYAFGALALTGTQFVSNTAQASGGGAHAAGDASLQGGEFHDNQCAVLSGCDGGALSVNGVLTATATQFISNAAHLRGGAVATSGGAAISGALFQDNTCSLNNSSNDCWGGGLFAGGSLTLTNTDFLSNTALARAGALWADTAANLTGGLFAGNTCTRVDCLGGAVLVNNGPLTLTGTQFISNSAGQSAGALYEGSGAAALTNALFQANACTQDGCQAGAVKAVSLVLSGTDFLTNTSRLDGAGAVTNGPATLTGGLFQGNHCFQAACTAGAFLAGTSLTASGTRFLSNTAQANGGAVRANQAVTLTNGLFQGNHCLVDGCSGGALYVDGSLALTGTQWISNTARQSGGGAYAGNTASLTGGLFRGDACTQAACQGGGLFVFTNGPVSLSNMQFVDNHSLANGGGARTAGATALSGGQFQNNQCAEISCTGGGLYVAGSLTLSGTQITGNQAGSDGAGLAATGAVTLTGGLLQNNQCTQASCRGGGLFAGGSLALAGTQLLNNTAGSSGGGAYATGAATLTNGQFQEDTCTQDNCQGGGLYVQDTLALTGTAFSGNSAHSDGGGLYAGGDAGLDGGVFQNNACTQDGCRGGGLHAVQGLILTGTQFLTNTARAGAGGAFGNAGAVSRVDNGLFLNNTCTQAVCQGGGLDVIGDLALTGTQFSHNSSAGGGGGLETSGLATLDRAAFFDNTAFQGGGLYQGGTGGHVINSVFGNNLAGGSGAAIFINTTGGTFILEQDTIGMPSFDVPTSSVQLLTGSVGITNTIFILYDFAVNSGTGSVYEDYNLFDQVSHPTTGNVVSGGHSFSGRARPANPVFDNYRLLPGSAAIDRGVDDGVPIDFDGQARPHGAGFDIGYNEAYLREVYLPLVKR